MTVEETKDLMKTIILEGMHWDGFTDLDSTIDELYSKVVSKSDSLPCVSESLLAKYIQHVRESEGIDFIDKCNDGMSSDVAFTREEFYTLKKLS